MPIESKQDYLIKQLIKNNVCYQIMAALKMLKEKTLIRYIIINCAFYFQDFMM